MAEVNADVFTHTGGLGISCPSACSRAACLQTSGCMLQLLEVVWQLCLWAGVRMRSRVWQAGVGAGW